MTYLLPSTMIRDPVTTAVLDRLRAIAPARAYGYDEVHRAMMTLAALGATAEAAGRLLEHAAADGVDLEDLVAYAVRIALA